MYRNPDEKQEFLSSIKRIVDDAFNKSKLQTSKSQHELEFELKKRTLRIGAFLATFVIIAMFGTCAVSDVFPNPDPERVQVLRTISETVTLHDRSCRFACEPYSVKKVDGSLCECSQTLLPTEQQIFTRALDGTETQANSN